jgi:hypothetical protein
MRRKYHTFSFFANKRILTDKKMSRNGLREIISTSRNVQKKSKKYRRHRRGLKSEPKGFERSETVEANGAWA